MFLYLKGLPKIKVMPPLEKEEVIYSLCIKYVSFHEQTGAMQKVCSQICRFMSFLLWIFTQRKYNSVQLFSKLFDEVEKIRCWKVQTNSDNVEKERRLHQNGRTIESLQRTIQELQVQVAKLFCLLLLVHIFF